jgi:hypothetical protein
LRCPRGSTLRWGGRRSCFDGLCSVDRGSSSAKAPTFALGRGESIRRRGLGRPVTIKTEAPPSGKSRRSPRHTPARPPRWRRSPRRVRLSMQAICRASRSRLPIARSSWAAVIARWRGMIFGWVRNEPGDKSRQADPIGPFRGRDTGRTPAPAPRYAGALAAGITTSSRELRAGRVLVPARAGQIPALDP